MTIDMYSNKKQSNTVKYKVTSHPSIEGHMTSYTLR